MRGNSSSYADFLNEEDTRKTPVLKRMAESEIFTKKDLKLTFLKDVKEGLNQSQNLTRSSGRAYSMDGKQRNYIFRQSPRRRNFEQTGDMF